MDQSRHVLNPPMPNYSYEPIGSTKCTKVKYQMSETMISTNYMRVLIAIFDQNLLLIF